MTLFNLQIENKIYTIDLFPKERVAITRHMMQLYTDFCAVNPDKLVTFDQWLVMVESQPHPENQSQIVEATDELSDDEINILCDQMRRKDKMIDALLEAIGKMKWIGLTHWQEYRSMQLRRDRLCEIFQNKLANDRYKQIPR